jgi:hypothetical protein
LRTTQSGWCRLPAHWAARCLCCLRLRRACLVRPRLTCPGTLGGMPLLAEPLLCRWLPGAAVPLLLLLLLLLGLGLGLGLVAATAGTGTGAGTGAAAAEAGPSSAAALASSLRRASLLRALRAMPVRVSGLLPPACRLRRSFSASRSPAASRCRRCSSTCRCSRLRRSAAAATWRCSLPWRHCLLAAHPLCLRPLTACSPFFHSLLASPCATGGLWGGVASLPSGVGRCPGGAAAAT